MVLVLDDLHWGDSLSPNLTSLLTEGLRPGPLPLLSVICPEREQKGQHMVTTASQKCRERYTALHLREVTPERCRQPVASLVTAEDLTSSVRQRLLQRSREIRSSAFLAEVHGRAEGIREGPSVVTGGLAFVDKDGEPCWKEELYRLKGKLLLKHTSGEAYPRNIETCFEHALIAAHRQRDTS